jgi:hypothetical protein
MSAKTMNSSMAAIVFILGASLLTGCATTIPQQSILIETQEKNKPVAGIGCEVTTSKGRYFVTTPATIAVQKAGQDLKVKCEKKMLTGIMNIRSENQAKLYRNMLFGKMHGMAVYDYPEAITVQMGYTLSVPPQNDDGPSTSSAWETDIRKGVSSATVEKLAKEIGCKNPVGAELLTDAGPIEEYELKCDLGGSVKARCELRQCKLQ